MTKVQAYRFLQDKRLGFTANVIACQYNKPAQLLKNLVKLIQSGAEFSHMSFSLHKLNWCYENKSGTMEISELRNYSDIYRRIFFK